LPIVNHIMDKKAFYAALTANNLDQYTPQFETLMQDSIRYHLTPLEDESAAMPGISKIGGIPDLPAAITWPNDLYENPLSFIAQLDFAEVKPFDTYNVLPETGYLFVFYDPYQEMGGYSLDEKPLFRVLYFDGPGEALIRTPFPEGLEDFGKYKPCSLKGEVQLSMPFKWGKDFSFLSKEERDIYGEKVWLGGYINKSLGRADNMQGEMEGLCQMVTNGFYPDKKEAYDAPENAALRAGEKDWLLLLQIDSNEAACGMRWADMGRLYFWIKKQDLLKRNFDDCWCILQSY